MTFWIIAAVMVAAALAFVVLPLLRKPRTEADRRRQQNITIAREQLAELEGDFKSGRLEQPVYEQTRQELELALHESLKAPVDAELEVVSLGLALLSLVFSCHFSALACI